MENGISGYVKEAPIRLADGSLFFGVGLAVSAGGLLHPAWVQPACHGRLPTAQAPSLEGAVTRRVTEGAVGIQVAAGKEMLLGFRRNPPGGYAPLGKGGLWRWALTEGGLPNHLE